MKKDSIYSGILKCYLRSRPLNNEFNQATRENRNRYMSRGLIIGFIFAIVFNILSFNLFSEDDYYNFSVLFISLGVFLYTGIFLSEYIFRVQYLLECKTKGEQISKKRLLFGRWITEEANMRALDNFGKELSQNKVIFENKIPELKISYLEKLSKESRTNKENNIKVFGGLLLAFTVPIWTNIVKNILSKGDMFLEIFVYAIAIVCFIFLTRRAIFLFLLDNNKLIENIYKDLLRLQIVFYDKENLTKEISFKLKNKTSKKKSKKKGKRKSEKKVKK
ncbi:hypothetical protein HX017_04375 [Myroides marinus]|nr:hypothetical protein [Myroides marinus]MDM1347854.1 hypothetical protein [Myroides marinus]MDM1351318.1 hypothetical protein [Myroides marinus]MDM1358525.1 hypothetical protein [Myroides marinus]MDM1361431.1 hypothetical protein [Myroides marinus]MDM1364188.1 hypothetical protein [Myroides marinus]